jgi:hypothetical protein
MARAGLLRPTLEWVPAKGIHSGQVLYLPLLHRLTRPLNAEEFACVFHLIQRVPLATSTGAP